MNIHHAVRALRAARAHLPNNVDWYTLLWLIVSCAALVGLWLWAIWRFV